MQDQQSFMQRQIGDLKEIIVSLQNIIQESGFSESDRAYMQDIGQTVDQLVDQVNDLTDQQDRFGSKLSKI